MQNVCRNAEESSGCVCNVPALSVLAYALTFEEVTVLLSFHQSQLRDPWELEE